MRKEQSIKDWKKMYDELTDPEQREKAKRATEKKEMIEEKISDTGL